MVSKIFDWLSGLAAYWSKIWIETMDEKTSRRRVEMDFILKSYRIREARPNTRIGWSTCASEKTRNFAWANQDWLHPGDFQYVFGIWIQSMVGNSAGSYGRECLDLKRDLMKEKGTPIVVTNLTRKSLLVWFHQLFCIGFCMYYYIAKVRYSRLDLGQTRIG